jgi:hypothetical protein
MHIFINRDQQLRILESLIVNSENNQRLVIVCADNGMGKTALLDEIYDRHRMQTAVALVDIGRTYDLLALLNDVADQMSSQGVDCSAYRTVAARLTVPRPLTVNVSDVRAFQSPIDITLSAIDDQRYVAEFLLSQLLADLETASGPLRRLLLIDRYEEAGPHLQGWLGTSLIPRLLHRSATICVLAGCLEPSFTRAEERSVERLSLEFLDMPHIGQWLIAAGVPQRDEFVEFLWQGSKGIPGNIYPFIINLVAARKSVADG